MVRTMGIRTTTLVIAFSPLLVAGCATPKLLGQDCCARRCSSRGFADLGRYDRPPEAVVAGHLPPPPLDEVVPPPPFPDAVWIPGWWDWQGDQWVWIPGRWAVTPVGYGWVAPSYQGYGTSCAYTPGYWQREREAAPPPTPPRKGRRNSTTTVSREPRSPPVLRARPAPRPSYRPAPPRAGPPVRADTEPAVRLVPPRPKARSQPRVTDAARRSARRSARGLRLSPASRPRARPPQRKLVPATLPRTYTPRRPSRRVLSLPSVRPRGVPRVRTTPSRKPATNPPAPRVQVRSKRGAAKRSVKMTKIPQTKK